MNPNHTVTKASGEQELFSGEKLRASLQRSGAPPQLVDEVLERVLKELYNGINTRKIYKMAFRLLRQKEKLHAARYSLKDAIMELGPTGFPFEHFVGRLLQAKGYQVEVGLMMKGKCISHEIDVLAISHQETILVECKYHNDRGKVCNVQVPLYVHSRFGDIRQHWKTVPSNGKKAFHGWIVTNTRFTSDAADYGLCAGLNLIGWDFPQHKGLKELVEQSGLFPITVLTGLTRKHKEFLLAENIILCRDLLDNKGLVNKIISDKRKADAVINEASDLCGSGL